VTRLRLAYIHAFRDRHGKPRHYFRRPGYKQIPLPGAVGSTEFIAAYQAAFEAQPLAQAAIRQPAAIGASRLKPGSVAAAVAGYFTSFEFANLAEETRQKRRWTLEKFRLEHGDRLIADLERRHIDLLLVGKRLGSARNFLTTLRSLIRFAIQSGLRSDDPTIGVRLPKHRSDGIYTWSDHDIAAFEAHHPIGTQARLALALLLYTVQRRADVIRLGRQHIRDGKIHFRQRKTGRTLILPVIPELQAVLNGTMSVAENLTFLVTAKGQPFKPDCFSHWFKSQVRAASLPDRCSVHGVRKAGCRRLAEAGYSANVIAAISGHMTLREVERYTKAADQARMASQGMASLGAVTNTLGTILANRSGKPTVTKS
jgi:integrase